MAVRKYIKSILWLITAIVLLVGVVTMICRGQKPLVLKETEKEKSVRVETQKGEEAPSLFQEDEGKKEKRIEKIPTEESEGIYGEKVTLQIPQGLGGRRPAQVEIPIDYGTKKK